MGFDRVAAGVVVSMAFAISALAPRVNAAPATMPSSVLPVGFDAYRAWDQWAYQRIGERGYMRSTYDHHGRNETADASHFLYQERDDFNVTLDIAGPGILYFFRTNHWHGSPWHFEVDGKDNIVSETSTANPDRPTPGSTFLPPETFPAPLAFTWSTTKGADLSWVPVPFEQSLRLAHSRTFYGTGYFIYHRFAEGTPLSQPLRAFDLKSPPPQDVLDLLNRSGESRIAPSAASESADVTLARGRPVTLFELTAKASIRELSIRLPREHASLLAQARLRITWDGRADASVDAPLSLFFGAGTLHNRANVEHLVKSFPMSIRFVGDEVMLSCQFPMPFFRSARVELISPDVAEADGIRIRAELKHEPLDAAPSAVGYFHATYRDHGTSPERGRDLVLLDTKSIEGSEDWSGSFVGTAFTFTDRAELRTLEGDPRFFFDDARMPQGSGTGTEEWGGGGDYWGGLRMSLPLAGHPVGAPKLEAAQNEEDKVHSAYRFLLADLFPFGRNARIQLEHGGENDMSERYRTVTYWYGLPAASLVPTDVLTVGNETSERGHAYRSPQASAPKLLSSRYELGVESYVESSAGPAAEPKDSANWTFKADAGTYFIYLRGHATRPGLRSDASWIQFDDDIGTDRQAASYASPLGAGNWQDASPKLVYAWSSAFPARRALKVTFERAGEHRLRLQPREGGHVIDQVWLTRAEQPVPVVDANDRPRSAEAEARPIDEIILDASTAKVAGEIRKVNDVHASTGVALAIESTADQQPVIVLPAEEKRVRYTRGTSEFTLSLRPDNRGVLLRRTLDYGVPNQRAAVFIADASEPTAAPNWERAGTWYTAGSNTWYHSFPRTELGASAPDVRTSNRRFREEELLLPLRVTQGRRAIRVRLVHEPVDRPLLPTLPVVPSAWSEIDYRAYCWITPEFSVGDK